MTHGRRTPLMSLVMVLTPNLATLTYAAPHLIGQTACAYTLAPTMRTTTPVQLVPEARRASAAAMVAQDPPPQPRKRMKPLKMQQVAEQQTQQHDEVELQTEQDGFLVKSDDTWRTTQALTPDLIDGELSDARLSTRVRPEGATEWEV